MCYFLIADSISDNDTHPNDCMNQLLSEEQLCQTTFDVDSILSDRDNANQQQFFSQLVNFIHDAKLNKTTTRSLLTLLRSTSLCTVDEIPKTTDALWQYLGVAFTFKTLYYCSICFYGIMAISRYMPRM